ncbi:MAG: type sorting protein [Bacteroidota bacterium]|nr:type sorting protein [Bacteroidota bacterium]
MKNLFTLFAALCFTCLAAHAQSSETEPNDSLQVANPLAAGTTISGQSCVFTDQDWYRIILPNDGILVVYTTASIPDATEPGQGQLNISLFSKTGAPFYGYTVRTGVSGSALSDTLTFCCMAADTFYLQAYRGWAFNLCWNYTLNWTVALPSFTNDAEPDQAPLLAVPMPYNTNVEGHLGFQNQPGGGAEDNNDFFAIVPPTDGVLKVNVSVEAEAGANAPFNVSLFDNVGGNLSDMSIMPGSYPLPFDTTLYWSCLTGGDTMHLRPSLSVYGELGFAYKMSYTMLAPVFGNDVEPNNTMGTAQVVDPNQPIEGHEYFYNESNEDYFKFYKPDTGFFQLIMQAETYAASTNTPMYLYLLDTIGNTISAIYPTIGVNSHPLSDTMYVATLAAGYYYLKPGNAYFGAPCTSYRLDITTPTITGINPVAQSQTLRVFPNPSSDLFTVDFGEVRNTSIGIYNSVGQLVETMLQNNERYVALGNKLSTGLYLLKAVDSTGNIVLQGKLIKTK